ncbi:MAG: T9SS type A sorting domain-containing protein, partial [Bacteroidota bacterium]|nr:T9SS type A sorting domain-containing protein [Bacteroidota bacterium]
LDTAFEQDWRKYIGKTGLESFNDIVTTDFTYIAVGQCNTRGEGYEDMYVVHLDSFGDTILHETFGGDSVDYGFATARFPGMPLVYFAGYNTSYGIEESGNAYVGASLAINIFDYTDNCKVSRVLWVNNVIEGRDNNSGLMIKGILGDDTKENKLITFAIKNEINVLALFSLGFIFDDRNIQYQYIREDKELYKGYLEDFIEKCNKKGILCGMVTDKTVSAMMDAAQFNQDYFNYFRSAKLDFQILEHEYWNAQNLKTLDYVNPPTEPEKMDGHFVDIWDDHKLLLTTLNNYCVKNANFWAVYDYLGFFYHRWDGVVNNIDYNGYDHDNLSVQNSKAQWLEQNTDGIFLHYYTNYQYNNGLDFLNSNVSSSSLVDRFVERLSLLGQQNNKTNVFPIFSAEYYKSSEDNCGEDPDSDYLGKYLDGPDANTGTYIGHNLRSVEEEYVDQHADMYNDVSYDYIQNVNLACFSWFKYSCVEDKEFYLHQNTYDNTLLDCPDFTDWVIGIEELNLKSHSHVFKVYPNPSNSTITIISNSNIEILRIKLYNSLGELIFMQLPNSKITFVETNNLKKGIYLLHIKTENNSEIHKLIKK